MLTGRREAGDAGEEEVVKVLDDVASATVITSFIGAVYVGSTIQICSPHPVKTRMIIIYLYTQLIVYREQIPRKECVCVCIIVYHSQFFRPILSHFSSFNCN